MIRTECSTCPHHQSPDWCSRISHGLSCISATPGEPVYISEELMEASVECKWTNPGALPTDAAARKAVPIFSGVLRYFPDALAAIAECSKKGNDQHNPGKPLHWDRSKSQDELDALTRHLVDAGTVDTDGVRHSTKVAWRALANLQKEIEKERTQTAVVQAGLGDEHDALTFDPRN